MNLSAWIFAGFAAAWIENDHRQDSPAAIALTPSCGEKRADRFARPGAFMAVVPSNAAPTMIPQRRTKH